VIEKVSSIFFVSANVSTTRILRIIKTILPGARMRNKKIPNVFMKMQKTDGTFLFHFSIFCMYGWSRSLTHGLLQCRTQDANEIVTSLVLIIIICLQVATGLIQI